jgi:hypothetical protein
MVRFERALSKWAGRHAARGYPTDWWRKADSRPAAGARLRAHSDAGTLTTWVAAPQSSVGAISRDS